MPYSVFFSLTECVLIDCGGVFALCVGRMLKTHLFIIDIAFFRSGRFSVHSLTILKTLGAAIPLDLPVGPFDEGGIQDGLEESRCSPI